ncbi:MAG TPA: short-chain dehydrogenase [Chitinophagaceae bacterium]|nr:short-chain dehydrogenase [Chitinophagaceae bacterium]
MKTVITGASRGLGFSLAEAFAAEGHDLYLTARNEVKLYNALESLMSRFPDQVIKAKPFDLSAKQGALDFGNWVLGQGVEPDILINNAGSFEPGRIIDEPEGQLENMLHVNVLSAYHLTRLLLPSMMKRKSGHIFNMSSIAALQAYPNGGSYSISKFALTGFSKNLREELKPYSIKVTCIYPGAVYTDSWSGSGVDPGRIMKPSDISDTLVQIARLSPQAVVEELVIRPLAGDV